MKTKTDTGKVERAEMVLANYGDDLAHLLADLAEYATVNRLDGAAAALATFATGDFGPRPTATALDRGPKIVVVDFTVPGSDMKHRRTIAGSGTVAEIVDAFTAEYPDATVKLAFVSLDIPATGFALVPNWGGN